MVNVKFQTDSSKKQFIPRADCPWSRLSVIALSMALLLTAVLAATVILRKQETAKTVELQKIYCQTSPASTTETSPGSLEAASQETTMETAPAAVLSPQERFLPLLDINPDTVGWLRAGYLIDEPVVYRDNDFYLNHNFYGDLSGTGTLFLDAENTDWMTEPYLVFYGHHLKDGSKFGGLKKYCSLSYLQNDPFVLWDPLYSDAPETYVVFSVFEASMVEEQEDYFYLRRFEELHTGGSKELEQLIGELRKRSLLELPIDVDAEDRIMVLVTCSYGTKDGRLLVCCRKVRQEETQDELKNAIKGQS